MEEDDGRDLETGEGLAFGPSVEVARADDRGRLVRARREGVKAGETVALSEVFVWAYMPRETKRLCAHCGRALLPSTARRCRGGCAHTWYCPPPSTENRDGDSTLYKNEDGEIVEKMEKMMVDKSSCEREGDRYHGLGGGGAGCRSMRRYDAAVATGLRKGTLAPSLFGSQEATMFARLVIGVLTHPDRRQRALTFALEPNTHALSPTRLAQYEVCLSTFSCVCVCAVRGACAVVGREATDNAHSKWRRWWPRRFRCRAVQGR